MNRAKKLAQELAEKKICRICLSKSGKLVEYLKEHEWKTMLTTCFAISTEIVEKLPKFLCEACGIFLEMCLQFKQICMKTERMMIIYPGTGIWPNKVEVPSWFRALQNQVSQQENAISNKRTFGESTDVMECDQKKPKIGTIHVGSYESLAEQSPISSEMWQVNSEQPSSNPRTEFWHRQNQPTQNSLSTRQPNPQHKPTPAQVTQPQQQQQQLLWSPSRSISSRQPETVQPLRTMSLPQPSSKPTVTPNIQGSRPFQPTASPSPSNSGISCTVCSFVFATETHLMYHMRKHTGLGQYRCGCNQKFEHLDRFIDHQQKQHDSAMLCILCYSRFRTTEDLTGHLHQHVASNMSQSCYFCAMVFVDSNRRTQHLVANHPEEVLQLMTLNPSMLA